MSNNFFQKFIDWSVSSNKTYKWLSLIFAPIFYIIYKLECKWFWNFIIDEIGDKDEIVKFLDRNEFGLTPNKLYKKDVIGEEDDLFPHSIDKIKEMIYNDFSQEFLLLLKRHCHSDIENYISLLVDVQLTRGENGMMKLYNVSFVYYRYNLYLKGITTLKWWLVIVGAIVASLYLIPIYL